MNGIFTLIIISVIPAYLASRLASKRGRSRWVWGFLAMGFSYLGLGLLALLPSKALPTLREYSQRFPECATGKGMKCTYCGSGSIRLWRTHGVFAVRQHHLCNHCGKSLYTT